MSKKKRWSQTKRRLCRIIDMYKGLCERNPSNEGFRHRLEMYQQQFNEAE